MSKIKRAGAWLLAAALTAGMLPAAGAAVSSDNAKTYLQVLEKNPGKDSYLVDFDADGADELVLIETVSRDEYRYEVYTGSKRVVNEKTTLSMGVYKKSGESGYYIGISPKYGDASGLTVYTLSGSKWVEAEDISEAWIGTKHYCRIDGVDVTPDELKQAEDAYKLQYWLDENATYHTVRSQLVNAVDTSVSGYEDVLSSLSASDKKALFDDLILPICTVADEVNCSALTDDALFQMLNNMELADVAPYESFGGRFDHDMLAYVFEPTDFTRFTQQYFGYTVDYSRYATTTKPQYRDAALHTYYNGKWYFRTQAGGWTTSTSVDAKHLYRLGGNKFSATFSCATKDSINMVTNTIHVAVVKKNANGTWTLLRLYPNAYTPTAAELAAFVEPSSWAKAEVEAAKAANLVPALTGDPAWQDNATRLQFAELIVQFAEQATGKTLAAAPSGTFTDTKSEAVLKAHAAGIVNGTSDTAFSPYDPLTREQLATMLWRAISYVQTETGKTAVTSGGSLSGYTDASKVSIWAKDAVSALAQNGIMKGTSGTTLSPAESCTVEQSVLLTYRTYQKLQ